MTLGHAVDLITVMDALQAPRDSTPSADPHTSRSSPKASHAHPNIESYVRIIKDKSLLRQLLEHLQRGHGRRSDQAEDATNVLNNVEAKLAEVADSAIQRGFSNIPEIVANSFGSIDALYEQGREITGLATHYIEFDKMTSGLQSSELIIIAARPSMGKTAWAINIAQNCAVRDKRSSPSSRSKCRRSRCCDACSPARRWSARASCRPASFPAKTAAS